MEALYRDASFRSSKVVTNCYSTSFSLGIMALSKEIHKPVYGIYGFVRLADEIVDTFHDQNKALLLQEFSLETKRAIERGLSLNPVLNSFQCVVNKYKIETELIDAFVQSMEFDLSKKEYDQRSFEEYIYGSAEVVGLMCLRIFCNGNKQQYNALKEAARALGSAFQKINFLRDLNDDFVNKGRSYFPNVNLNSFTETDKSRIEADILNDFNNGFKGIKYLPNNSKLGVYTAYIYYLELFNKIKGLKAERIIEERIRISNAKKYYLLMLSFLKYKLGMI